MLCQCAAWPTPFPERGQCLILCGNEIPKKHVICRPCAKGNHTGKPCRQYVPEHPRNLVHTCKDCGYDSAIHEVGSDGRAN